VLDSIIVWSNNYSETAKYDEHQQTKNQSLGIL